MFVKYLNFILGLLIILTILANSHTNNTQVHETITKKEYINNLNETKSVDTNNTKENKTKEVTNEKTNEETIGTIIFENGKEVNIYNNPTDKHMTLGAGKLLNNSVLNKSGNSIILGHNNRGFNELKNVNTGSLIRIKTKNEEFIYIVTKTYITKEEDGRPYKSTKNTTITLITCYPFDYLGYTNKRYIVVAEIYK